MPQSKTNLSTCLAFFAQFKEKAWKSRFRPYMMQFLRFASKEDEQLCATIRQQNVLVIDDVATSGSTINEILRTLRIINEDNDITIFSLIGRKDLMAEAN